MEIVSFVENHRSFFSDNAYSKQLVAKLTMLLSVLCCACNIPLSEPKSNICLSSPSQASVATPPFALISTALYTSPYAWRAITIGLVQVGTRGVMPLVKIGARNTVPSIIARIVAFGDGYSLLSLNSSSL